MSIKMLNAIIHLAVIINITFLFFFFMQFIEPLDVNVFLWESKLFLIFLIIQNIILIK